MGSAGGMLAGARTWLLATDYSKAPVLFRLRSHTLFILGSVGLGLFSDLFLYGLVVPILPFMLADRVHIPQPQIQSNSSNLLAAYAVASFLFSPFAGWIGDKTSTRRLPFLAGLVILIASTLLLYSATTVPGLLVARLLQGASAAVVWTIGLALCVDTVGSKKLGTTLGTIFSLTGVGDLMAPVVGGALYEKAGLFAVGAVSVGILVLDLVMRLMVIEKREARLYIEQCPHLASEEEQSSSSETDRLLPQEDATNNNDDDNDDDDDDANEAAEREKYRIPKDLPPIVRQAPVLYCLTDASLALSLVVMLSQAFTIASFESTIPTHAHELYGFTSLNVSVLFIPLSICNVVFGPLVGWLVDRYGPKPVAVGGFGALVPMLAVLRIPRAEPRAQQVVLYAALLALCGIGVTATGGPASVESALVVEKFHRHNPDVFGENGPYAQLYGLTSIAFCAGLAAGPVAAGMLKEAVGYGDMCAVVAGVCGATALACYVWLGGVPRHLRRWTRTKSM